VLIEIGEGCGYEPEYGSQDYEELNEARRNVNHGQKKRTRLEDSSKRKMPRREGICLDVLSEVTRKEVLKRIIACHKAELYYEVIVIINLFRFCFYTIL
jgi:hypothetical protein